ncbi:VOC family protein [Gemmatimonas groenlandica]|uniref:Glyoxalase n=1 Tax=Gemmatimonas groenlandica TaxID=2732249 RepID=A0A6M4IQX0_9BACT|nr:VOC family protein [Gemmatimonas groenlandica]QJR37133.1 glyoxalase [Gemmatimonas groenlandica]
MAIVPHTIDLVVADMTAAMVFYRTLGLDVPDVGPEEAQVQVSTLGGATLGFVTEELMKGHNPHWVQPVGQRVTFACRCDSANELDETYARVVAAGYEGRQEPWDAPWGQRYAMVGDPDGNRVDLFAAISEEGEE